MEPPRQNIWKDTRRCDNPTVKNQLVDKSGNRAWGAGC
jgi:hypothetical protein